MLSWKGKKRSDVKLTYSDSPPNDPCAFDRWANDPMKSNFTSILGMEIQNGCELCWNIQWRNTRFISNGERIETWN